MRSSDEDLVELANGGSDPAFSELIERYQVRLLRFLLTRCANRADAEDALQDTFISAYRYLHSFNPRWRFSTWIYRIGIRNAMRVKRPVDETELDVADHNAGPLAECIAASDRENLWAVARKIFPEQTYTAMWLRYVEDMSIKEVSKTLDRSVSWTKVTLLRARRRLSDEMSPQPVPAKRGNYG
jgi:RNA polymerase sigma-70 factor (ECF subfamily)